MTIKELIERYRIEYSTMQLLGKDNVFEATNETLKELANALLRGSDEFVDEGELVQWQKELNEVTDYQSAMLAFFDMEVRGISKRVSAYLAYYYASMLIDDQLKSNESAEDAYYMRSMIVFKNMNAFFDQVHWIRKDQDLYKGQLDERQFNDLLLLANVYCAWNVETDNPSWDNVRRQVPIVASNHPGFSKTEVIKVGLEASDAMFKYIQLCLANNHITRMRS